MFQKDVIFFKGRKNNIYISKFLVTNEQYVFFLNDLGLDYESALEYYNLIAEDSKIYYSKDQYLFYTSSEFKWHPVVNVTHFGAEAYCKWEGGRLITAEEWDFVATNAGTTCFPNGNNIPTTLEANFSEVIGMTTEVGMYKPSLIGVFDLLGNVWEWTSTLAQRRNDIFEKNYLIKGGGWSYTSQNFQMDIKAVSWERSAGNCLGFRVVFDTNRKKYNCGIIVGRFSPLHNGHIRIINKAIEECEHFYICIADNNDIVNKENFQTLDERIKNLKIIFTNVVDDIISVKDNVDDSAWISNIINNIPKDIDIVYLGENKDFYLWVYYSKKLCKMIKRLDEGISGKLIRKNLQSGKSITNMVPGIFEEEYKTSFAIRKYIINDIKVDDMNQKYFQNMIEGFCSLDDNLYRYSTCFKFSELQNSIELITNNYQAIECVKNMFKYFEANNVTNLYKIYAIYISKNNIPDIHLIKDYKWQKIELHQNQIGYRVVIDKDLEIIKTDDFSFLYIWNKRKNTLIAYYDVNNQNLIDDPMRIIRGMAFSNIDKYYRKIHSACFEYLNEGFLICGSKGAGKTSVFLKIISNIINNIKFISDDKLYLSVTNNNAVGSTQAVRIDKNTISNMNLKNINFDYCTTNVDRFNDKIQIFPKYLCNIMSIEFDTSTKIKYGIVVNMDKGKSFKFERTYNKDLILSSLKITNDAIYPYWLFDYNFHIQDINEIDIFKINWFILEGNIFEKEQLDELIKAIKNIKYK